MEKSYYLWKHVTGAVLLETYLKKTTGQAETRASGGSLCTCGWVGRIRIHPLNVMASQHENRSDLGGKFPFLNCITLHGLTSSLFLKTLPSAESDLITSCPSQHGFLCRWHGCVPHLETQGNDKGGYCPQRASGRVCNLGFKGQMLPLFRRMCHAQNEQTTWHRGVWYQSGMSSRNIFFFPDGWNSTFLG